MKTRNFTRLDVAGIFLLEVILAVFCVEGYSEFSQEWGMAALDVVFPAAILAVGMCLTIYYQRSEDNSSRRFKLLMALILIIIIIFAPSILPKWRLFELMDAIGGYGLLAGMGLGHAVWELHTPREQQEESSE